MYHLLHSIEVFLRKRTKERLKTIYSGNWKWSNLFLIKSRNGITLYYEFGLSDDYLFTFGICCLSF
jgi:hypothetical protein